MTGALSILALFFAAVAIVGAYRSRRTLHYVFKPLATAVIIVVALVGNAAHPSTYGTLVAAGLGMSLVGDICMMFPERLFLAALATFTITHLLYSAAFVSGTLVLSWWLLPLPAVGLVVYALLHRYVGAMRIPVIVYLVVILTMAGCATARWAAAMHMGAPLAMAGAYLFIASDALIALDRFRKPFKAAMALVLITYWSAQLLIALSVGGWGML